MNELSTPLNSQHDKKTNPENQVLDVRLMSPWIKGIQNVNITIYIIY